HDLARLGRALRSLPALAAALSGEDGRRPVGRVAALLVGAVATGHSADAWIDLARRVTVRELRREIRRAREAGSEGPSAGAEVRDAGVRTANPPDAGVVGEPRSSPVESGVALSACSHGGDWAWKRHREDVADNGEGHSDESQWYDEDSDVSRVSVRMLVP